METNIVKNLRTDEHKDTRMDDCPALTLTAKQVAAMLNISVRQVWRLHTTGRLPSPIRLGHCVRWRRKEIVGFVDQGAPTREKWDALTTKATKDTKDFRQE